LIYQIALATGNSHKIQELQSLLSKELTNFTSWKVLSPQDAGVKDFAPEEIGSSFEENARIKSESLFAMTQIPSLADDSGICVDSLEGQPGVYSARFGGKNLNDRQRAELLLEKLKFESNRIARFVSVISFTNAEGTVQFEGRVEGEISKIYNESGQGFGYDPIFFYPPLNRCFSELNMEEKNKISHRSIALLKFIHYLAERTGPPVNLL
jgi:XTP/dITP diphosphohydrolase